MPTTNANPLNEAQIRRRIGKAVVKVGTVCMGVRTTMDGIGSHVTEAFDALDTVVGGAHGSATEGEIEAMIASLDEAITEAHTASVDLRSSVEKMREVRGRLDRAMNAMRTLARTQPPTLGARGAGLDRMAPRSMHDTLDSPAYSSGDEPEDRDNA